MQKLALFVFNGDPMCFIHVLLNALEMKTDGYEVKIIIEGAATKLIPQLIKKENPLHQLWEKTIIADLVEGVCQACAKKMGVLAQVKEQKLALLSNMSGHPSMSEYRKKGFEIITF